MGSDQSPLPSSLSPFITQTRLEREGHLEWGEGSFNESRVLDLSEVGGMISVGVLLPARNKKGGAIIKADRKRMVVGAPGVI